MKISKNQLKSMIMEELQSVLSEQDSPLSDDAIADSLEFIDPPRGQRGVVSPIPAAAPAAAPAATPRTYSGGYSYVRDDAGGFRVTKDGQAAGYAKPGSPEARSIAAEIGGGVYNPKQQRFMQRATAADVMPGKDVSTGFSLNSAPAAATPKAVAFVDDMLKNPAGTTYRGPRRNVVRSLMNDPGVVDQDGLSSNRISQRQAARKFVRDYSERDPDAAPFGRFGRRVTAPSPARRDIEEMIYEALLEEFGDK